MSLKGVRPGMPQEPSESSSEVVEPSRRSRSPLPDAVSQTGLKLLMILLHGVIGVAHQTPFMQYQQSDLSEHFNS